MEGLGLLRAQRRIDASKRDGAGGLEGEVVIEGREVTLQLVLEAAFPLRLPRFFLEPWDALGFIPHVEKTGLVCFADAEGLVLDRRRPVDVIEAAFRRVVGVLTDGVRGQNAADWANELEAHWQRLPGGLRYTSLLDPTDELCVVWLAVDHGTDPKQRYVARGSDDISAFFNGADLGKKVSFQHALYLPLEPDCLVVPPSPGGPMWSVSEIQRLLAGGLSAANYARLLKAIKGRPNDSEHAIVRVPRPSGGDALIGIRFEGTGARHPLGPGGSAAKVVPLKLERRERTFLVPRGGGEPSLGKKRVLLVGGGAIGGHLAFELARAGVLDLTIIDPDGLTAENSFRHVLGRRSWGMGKARALKQEIEAQLPYVRVVPVVARIEDALATGSLRLEDYDLVVLASGNPTVELEVNERLHATSDGPGCLFTWVEPLGIGGHALLITNPAGEGCFECLYTEPGEPDQPLVNRAAFAAPGQSFGRALTGCGSLHTPYGSVDALRTAVLATRLAIDALTEKESGNVLRSWKGDAAAFDSAGFRLSERYNATQDQLDQHRYAFAVKECRVCGSSGRLS